MNNKIKPSRLYYGIAVLIAAIGIALSVMLIINLITTVSSSSEQIVMPSSTDIELVDPGKYYIYYEYESVVDGKIYSTGSADVSGFRVFIVNKSNNENVELLTPIFNSNYSFSGRTGYSVFEFMIEEPGSYEITGHYEHGAGEEIVLAIGKGFVGNMFASILGAIAILFGSTAICIAIIVITTIKRRKHIKNQQEFSINHPI